MRTGIWPVVVIPIWIPFKSSARIELLNVASRIVANQKSLSEDTAVFTYIEVEALYLEINHGLERSGHKLERSGGYVRRINTLTSIIRNKYGSKDCQPTIEFEKFVLQPGAEGPNAHVLEGEIGIAWPEESAPGANPDPALEQRCATNELGKLILNKVQVIHPLSFTVQKTVSVNKRPKAVANSITTCTATASWQNHAAVIKGTLDLCLHLEYGDGTLGRWSEAIKYQVPEPLIPNYAHNLYVFIDQCHVDPKLATDTGADMDNGNGKYSIEITVIVKGIIAETCSEAVSLHAPSVKITPHFKALQISGAIDTQISCQKKELSGAVTVPGIPTGHMTHRLTCGRLEQTGGSLLQEITALCDLFYVDAEGEKCLEIQLADIILTSIGAYPTTASFCGAISADGEPVIAADLGNPGKFNLTVPFSYQLTMHETKIMDAYVGTAVAEAGSAANTDCAEKALDSVKTVDTVVEEVVAQKQTGFLVEFPVQTKCSPAVKHPPVKTMPLSQPVPELAYECLPETDSCLIKGTVDLVSYAAAMDGREVYQPARVDFCEKIIVPGCRPDLIQRCNLRATAIDPPTSEGNPSVLIEVDLVLYHYRRCAILTGTPVTRQPGYSDRARTDNVATLNEYNKQLLVLEHRLFWQSRPPSGTSAEPVRIETKTDNLRWRIADELLIIDGMVGRALYFVDRNQRLYCSGARIPFRMAALLSEQTDDIRQIRIQKIDGMALPRTKKGVELCLEEEYHIFLEIVRKT